MASFDEVVAQLVSCGQEHVLAAIPDLSSDHPIYEQLKTLNIDQSIANFKSTQDYDTVETHSSGKEEPSRFSPVQGVVDITTNSTECEKLDALGKEAVSQGKVAAVIMSGGQGTRLGFSGPKGMYNLGMLSGKTIFQLHIEKIQRIRIVASTAAGLVQLARVPVYIMTSNLNHDIIVNYFRENNFFGYPEADMIFFQQGVEPAFTLEGKVIIESKSSLSLAPDGNGGIYRAMQRGGCIEDMIERGVEHLHIYGIDNVLTKALDPLFIGACIKSEAEVGNKVVWRADKVEKVGVTAECNGKMHILEYSEIPPALAEKEDAQGKLLFGAANICNHYMSVAFLRNIVLPNLSGTYHVAKKKIPYLDIATGKTVTPTSVNGVKLEMFIFDVFPLAKRWTVVEGKREREFAPVKNAPGSAQDSPDTARALLSSQAQEWLRVVGAHIEQPSGGSCTGSSSSSSSSSSTDCLCEISPLKSYAGEGLEEYANQTIQLPIYIN